MRSMKGKPVGYIIGSFAHDDFFVGGREGEGMQLSGYFWDPGEAKRFPNRAEAQRFCDGLDREGLHVCRLFDQGSQWWVEWPVPPGAPETAAER